MAVGAWNERFLSNFDCLYLANAGTYWSADYTIRIAKVRGFLFGRPLTALSPRSGDTRFLASEGLGRGGWGEKFF